ncbi:MAG: porin [Draconibacterium sp.]
MKKTLLQLFMFLLVCPAFSQESTFQPSGSAFATIFANYHQGLTSVATDESAFELVRGYIGYEYKFSPEFYAKVNVDIGSPEDLSEYAKARRYAYFKNAFLRYTQNKLQVEFGLISLRQYKLMEKVWERRYMMKTLADEYSIGASADLGMNLNYKFTNFWDIDFTIMNGEGYNNVQTDGIFKYAIGSTILPVKNFTTRLYYDFTNNDLLQSTYHIFLSYDFNGKANIAGEALYRTNEKWKEGQDRYGYSLYAKYNLTEKYQLFARFDKMASNKLTGEETPWNLADDGTALVAGIQFEPIKKIKMALNYHDWVPYASNGETKAFIFLDLEVKL